MDGADVGMVQGGEDLRLALEAGQTFGVGRKDLRQDLEGHIAVQFRITRAIHLAHATAPEGADDFIRAELRPGCKRHRHKRGSRTKRMAERTLRKLLRSQKAQITPARTSRAT